MFHTFAFQSWTHIAAVAVWGGLMALERRAFLQAMFSRPLVASTVTGVLLGDVRAGLAVGLLMELFHLSGASLGGAHADHDTLPAVAAAALAAGMGSVTPDESTAAMYSLAVLMCAPFGRAGRILEDRLDLRAQKYFGRAVTAADAGNPRRMARQNLRAMWPQFVFYGLICAAAAVAGPGVEWFQSQLPTSLQRGLAWAYPAMAMVAGAVGIAGTRAPRKTAFALASALTVGVALWLHR